MTGPNQEFYARRIERVLRFIGDNLDGDLSLDRLSDVAGFSKFHFHRQFREYTGISAARLIALLRMKQASLQLVLAPELRVLDIALDAGFDSPESFARAFKKAQGQSPSSFRTAPQWEHWGAVFQVPVPVGPRSNSMQVKIVDFPDTRVAVLEHRGPPASLMNSVSQFIAWRKSCDVSPVTTTMTLGVAYDDPGTTDPDDFRFDICGSTERDVPHNEYGVIEKTIPGGRCAVLRHVGSTDLIGATVHKLYGQWLPQSGEQTRDFPVFFHYVKRMPAVREHEQETDVYLPLA